MLAVVMNTTRLRSNGTAEIIVAERVVLLRIEHFEQRRARIALDAGAELVDFVEHHHAVARTGLADRLDDVAGQGADVSAAMAADFRLVVHAAKRHTHEFPAHGARDRLAERGLADARRADKAEDRRLALRRELAHGEILDDPPFDLVEIVMVLVEDAAGFDDVDRLRFGQRPRQFDQPVEIAAHHAVFAGRFRHALQPAQFLARLLLDFFGHAGIGDRLVELGHLGGLAFLAFAELALDRRHLLAQQDFTLALVERDLGLPADLLRQAQDFDAVGEEPRDFVHARGNVDGLEDFLFLLGLHVHIGDRQIGERRRAVDRLNRGEQIGRRLRQELDGFERLRLQIDEARLDLGGLGIRLRELQHARDEERPAAEIFNDLEALLALADQMMRAVRPGDIAHDIGQRAHAVHVDRGRLGDLGVALQQYADLALVAHRLLGGGNRLRPAQRDRQHQAGKQHGVAHRHDDERIGRQRRHGGGALRAFVCRQHLHLSHGSSPLSASVITRHPSVTA